MNVKKDTFNLFEISDLMYLIISAVIIFFFFDVVYEVYDAFKTEVYSGLAETFRIVK